MNTKLLIISIYAGIITIIAIVFIGLYTYIQSSKIDPKIIFNLNVIMVYLLNYHFQLTNCKLGDKSLCDTNETELYEYTPKNIKEVIIYYEIYFYYL